MSTQAVGGGTAQNAAAALDNFYTEHEAVAFGFAIEEKDGKKTRTATIFSSPEDAEKAEKEGKAEEISVVDTVVTYPKTLEALLSIATTDQQKEELVANHNRGAKNKVANRTNSKILKVDSNGNFTLGEKDLTNGVLDMSSEILSESKRKVLTDDERFARFVADMGITPDKAAKMKEVWLSVNAA